MRRQSKAKTNSLMGFKHRDFVEYTDRNGETYRGYITALSLKQQVLKFQSRTKTCMANVKKCKLLWRYSKIYWLDNEF